MKVEVIHKDEKRDGSIKYTLVASVNMCSPYYGLQDDLEFAYERTQNTEGSWSKDIGLPNPDGDRIHLTVEAPLPEFTAPSRLWAIGQLWKATFCESLTTAR